MKFYEDPVYIKMCEKADEIQDNWIVSCGDYCILIHPKDRRVVIVSEGNLDIRTRTSNLVQVIFPESYYENRTLEYLSRMKWLPRQDQLQEMTDKKDWMRNLVEFYDFAFEYANQMCSDCFNGHFEDGAPFYENCINEILKKWSSLEQLWLAFVMKEKYQKTWDGDRWIN